MDNHTLNYGDIVAWLFNLQFFGIKLGLDNILTMAARRGNPHRAFPVVHVAGTNGKGSTASFIAAALQAAGYRTGLYTSPHLVDFNERIRVDGKPIPHDDVISRANDLRPDVDELQATFFEATTLMAFMHFADRAVDIAVIETGLGGRLDATNIVLPECSVITGISFDHTEFLGTRIEDIASEKAGIIKAGIPVVSGATNRDATNVLESVAAELSAPFHEVRWQGRATWTDFASMECDLPGFDSPARVGLVGKHQAGNAALALAALRILKGRGFDLLSDDALLRGFRDVRVLTGLRGRLHCLQSSPELVVDVGHNPEGLRVMLEAWCAVREPERTHAVFGVMSTKDHREMLAILAAHRFASLTLVQASVHDARGLADLLDAARDLGLPVRPAPSVADGVREALETATEESVLLFGSHYVVGELLADRKKTSKNDNWA